MSNKLHHGDCLEVMPTLDADSVDAIISDPPYGLSFMGKAWDHGVPGEVFWREALRVAKPGAHLLAFGGTRTFHRLTVAIEDAGWEIRDCVMWVYGSGFPKSHDVSKAIDKAAGVEFSARPASGVGFMNPDGRGGYNITNNQLSREGESTPEAAQWHGWRTALKPAWEPIIVARKPLIGTVAANVLAHGTGAINIDACRVGDTVETWPKTRSYGGGTEYAFTNTANGVVNSQSTGAVPGGRWPANLIHDGSDEVTAGFPVTTSGGGDRNGAQNGEVFNGVGDTGIPRSFPSSTGSAARFFYCAKASKADRDEGCEGMPQTIQQSVAHGDKQYGTLPYTNEPREMNPRPRSNNHPTVKPTALMRYLCKLVTPLNGIILDPFMGSGSTGKAATLERFNFIGIDLSAEYVAIAQARIDAATKQIAEQLQYGSS